MCRSEMLRLRPGPHDRQGWESEAAPWSQMSAHTPLTFDALLMLLLSVQWGREVIPHEMSTAMR